MKTFKNILWGLLFVALGVLIMLRSFDIIDFEIFFDGWWTLFIIVPCFMGLISGSDTIGNLIGLGVGVLLLLACNDIITFELISKLIVPLILIGIGLSFIFKNTLMNINRNKAKRIDDSAKHCATFSGQKLNYKDEKFTGTSLDAIFGGIELDLRDAKLEDDATIEASAIFGGITIFIPEDVAVKVVSNSIFGGVDNKHDKNVKEKTTKTIYINANCLFGGVEIK